MCLRLMIVWQSTKDLTQAIIMLKENKTKKLFLQSEERLRKVWKWCGAMLLFQALFVALFYGVLDLVPFECWIYFILFNDLIIIPGLTYSYS